MSGRLFTNSGKTANLRLRLVTAAILLPVALLASFAGGIPFLIILLPVMCIGMLEFYVMEKDTAMQGSSLTGIPTGIAIVLGFFLNQDWLWLLAAVGGALLTLILEFSRQPKEGRRALAQVGITMCGIIYIAFPAAFLLSVRNSQPDGLVWLFVVYAIT